MDKEIILDSVKKSLGILPEYTVFDDSILDYINMALARLHQLGVGPEEGYVATDETTWSDIISEPRFNMLKEYIKLKTKILFDPPSTSFLLQSYEDELKDLEWRICSEVECYGE
nr:MAG TPA: hypothetical protein [Caudoviricetes sp.]